MKPLVYVAGPYTSPDPVENTHNAILVGMDLSKTGLAAVIIPHLSMLAHMVTPEPYQFWLDFDLDQLRHCHALFRMAGDSSGADAEVAKAHEWGIPVFTNYDELLQWLDERQARSLA